MTTTLCAVTLLASLMACVESDGPEDDTGVAVDGGASDDTGDGAIPFEVVVQDATVSQACGPKGEPAPSCGGAGMVVLPASSEDELETLFALHMPISPPKMDFDGTMALVSYLALCPSKSDRLVMDHIELAGTTLQVDEIYLLDPAPNQVVGCLYNVVTIPETDFAKISTSLTEVLDEEK